MTQHRAHAARLRVPVLSAHAKKSEARDERRLARQLVVWFLEWHSPPEGRQRSSRADKRSWQRVGKDADVQPSGRGGRVRSEAVCSGTPALTATTDGCALASTASSPLVSHAELVPAPGARTARPCLTSSRRLAELHRWRTFPDLSRKEKRKCCHSW